MNIIQTVIGTPLGLLMRLCYQMLDSYGWALAAFTVLTRFILFPISLWVQKNSVKMVRLQPQINYIAAAGGERSGREQMALYKREGYHPMAGIVPLLIQVLIIVGLISVVYNPLTHLLRVDAAVADAFVRLAEELSGEELGAAAQLRVIDMIHDPGLTQQFANLPVSGAPAAALDVFRTDLTFFGLDLSRVPTFTFDSYLFFPIFSGLSSLILSIFQNRASVLQREQGFFGKWGTAIFFLLFSLYFAFVVPAGLGMYWGIGNLLGIVTLWLCNLIYNPKKSIDYESLERSKHALAQSKAHAKASRPSARMLARAKADYKRFIDPANKKQLVYYSEKSGFYKYFAAQIDLILAETDIVIHYVTSDPHDKIFEKNHPQLLPYYINDQRLIPLFMRMDADVAVMTTKNLQTYHLKRSLVRRDMEYIYTPHDPMSIHMVAAKGAVDHFDTVFCVGQYQIDEIRATEKVYGLRPKRLVPCGYAMMDDLFSAFEKMDHTPHPVKRLLIAPSWQDDNLLDSCIDPLLSSLLDNGYDITIRPHPEYVKRYPARLQDLIDRYAAQTGEHFRIEADFTSSESIFTADLLITDWSGTALEFAYTTLRPVLFIDTPMKVMNPEYTKIGLEPLELRLRRIIGVSLPCDDAGKAADAAAELLSRAEDYREIITAARNENLFHPGRSAQVAVAAILEAIERKSTFQRKESEAAL